MDLQALATWVPLASPNAVDTRVYYRSKLYSLPDELSPFVSAANPIFSLLDRIALAKDLPAPFRVLGNLDHELKAFYSKLNSQKHCSVVQNSLAYYMLTATVDEILARSYMRLYGKVVEFKAFTPLTYSEEEPQVKFFSILALLKQKPLDYLPLIELAYYCLMTGFEGQYQGKPDGRQILEAEIDALFRLISQYRPCFSVNLFTPIKAESKTQKPYYHILILLAFVLSALFVTVFISETSIESKANELRFNPAFITSVDE
ncbi:MAG: hypothetical protein A3F18_08685 [Legionellales bacterium RIFCSPHIGHO2_12_FULL_37_14]|nr:MAG: hypothetical protein A3F18_08685 [Legionellales bacterium RIFCSPHIGHO2_12_FULL_37_14]